MITSHLNTYYFIPTTITTINQSLNSFKCMIKGASLTSLYRGGILLESYQLTNATQLEL